MPEGLPSRESGSGWSFYACGAVSALAFALALAVLGALLINEYARLGLAVLSENLVLWLGAAGALTFIGYRAQIAQAAKQESADELLKEIANRDEQLEIAEQERGHLAFASRRFEELFQSIPTACFTIDAYGTIYEWNRAAEEFYGLRAHQAIQNTVFNLIANEDNEDELDATISEVFAGRSVEKREIPFDHSEGGRIYGLMSAFPLHGQNGAVTGGVCAITDVTQRVIDREELASKHKQLVDLNSELEEVNKVLAERAETDGLTGLYNHRKFQESLETVFERATSDRPYGLLMLDVDEFKSYNDTYGHPAGDEVLRGVAEVLKGKGRSVRAYRYGGEEFAVIVRGGGRHALMLAEQIRQEIEEHQFPYRRITVSIGVTEHPGGQAKCSSEVIEQADRALYVAKNSGRNRVSAFEKDAGSDLGRPAA